MHPRTNTTQARRRVVQVFTHMLDDVLPEQDPCEVPYYELMSRARALKNAVYEAVLDEYDVHAPSSQAGADPLLQCNGAD